MPRVLLAAFPFLAACASTLDLGTATAAAEPVTIAKGARVLLLDPVVRQGNVVELDLAPWPDDQAHPAATPLRDQLARRLQGKGLEVTVASAAGAGLEAALRDLRAHRQALVARQREPGGASAVLASLQATAPCDYVGVLRLDQWLGKGGDAFSSANLARMRFVLLAAADGATAFAAEAVMRVRLTENSAESVSKAMLQYLEVR